MDFNVINENNVFKLGNIISIFKIPKIDREIALFSIEDFDNDDANLNIGYIDTDENGYDYLSEIDDDKIFKEAMKVVKDIMKVTTM